MDRTASGSQVLPTPDEAAAIAAALELVMGGDSTVEADPVEVARWRFAGRWWTKPVPQRRDRP